MVHGFLQEVIKQEDYIFGDNSIATDILQPDHNWLPFLPPDDLQARNGFEVYDCATMATKHCILTILKRLYNFNDDYSARYVAKMTGTDIQHGNSPQAIAEFIRHNGFPDEYEWPYEAATFEEFYRIPPTNLSTSARVFTSHYQFTHDYVPNDPQSIKTALLSSPLGFSVYGWQQLDNGLYAAGNGRDEHFVELYDYAEGQYWCVFDTYDSTHKKVEWAHRPVTIKRYSITLTPQTISWIQKAILAIQAYLYGLTH